MGFDIKLVDEGWISALIADDNTAYTNVDSMPVFCDDEPQDFASWVRARVEKQFGGDTTILKGTVQLDFVVERDGSVSGITVGGTPNVALARAVGETAATASGWFPGTLFDASVRVVMKVPVCFEDPAEMEALRARHANDMLPRFDGEGLNRFRSWVMTRVVYPEEAVKNNIQGRVTVAFVVEKDGSVADVQVIDSPSLYLSNEVVRIIRSSPAWTPGVQGGGTRDLYVAHRFYNYAKTAIAGAFYGELTRHRSIRCKTDNGRFLGSGRYSSVIICTLLGAFPQSFVRVAKLSQLYLR